ncbi:MAG TPA: hypothetical protein EYP07_05530, partial [Kiloniellaceae bacterium]|nr:hypothetical protein [Kiloniellaceae bacterium]
YLVEALNPQRSLSHPPLFQVMFALQNAPLRPARLGQATISPLLLEGRIDDTISRFDLTFYLNETSDGLNGVMEYNSDLFDRSTIVRLLADYQRLLEAIVAAPRQAVSEYRFYAADQAAQWQPQLQAIAQRRQHQRGLQQLEQLLNGHPEIEQAVVMEDADSVIVAHVQSALGDDVNAAVYRYIRDQQQRHLLPTVIETVDEWPRTAWGAIDRVALQGQVSTDQETPYEAPRGTTEELLATLWRRMLDCERVGRNDNFFSLGGYSLLATQLIARIRDNFGVEITVRDLFEEQTLSGQAQVIEAARQRGDSAAAMIEPRPAQTPAPLSFAQQRLWFLSQLVGRNAVYNMPLALHLRGGLQPEALRTAVNEIVSRHEVLRSRFIDRGDGAELVIDPATGLSLPV